MNGECGYHEGTSSICSPTRDMDINVIKLDHTDKLVDLIKRGNSNNVKKKYIYYLAIMYINIYTHNIPTF